MTRAKIRGARTVRPTLQGISWMLLLDPPPPPPRRTYHTTAMVPYLDEIDSPVIKRATAADRRQRPLCRLPWLHPCVAPAIALAGRSPGAYGKRGWVLNRRGHLCFLSCARGFGNEWGWVGQSPMRSPSSSGSIKNAARRFGAACLRSVPPGPPGLKTCTRP